MPIFTSSMILARSAVACLALTVATLATASTTEAGHPAPASETASLERIGFGHFSTIVKEGAPAYEWVRSLARNSVIAREIALIVHYPVDLPAFGGGSPQDSILNFGGGTKDLGVPDGPEPLTPGRIGQSISTDLTCVPIRNGTSQSTGDVRYNWEWRNRTDSNGDGKLDSNPGWVLVSVTVTFLAVEEAVLC